MTAAHQLSVFNIDQAAIYPLLTDVPGTTPTYSAQRLVPGIQNVALNPDTLAKELYGEGAVQSRAAKLRQFMATFTYAFLDMDVLATLSGSPVVDTGSGSAAVATQDSTANDIPGYFAIEFRILQIDVPGGSLNVRLHKCKITDTTPGLAAKEDYALQSFAIAAIPCRGTGNKIMSKISYSTAALLTA